MPGFFLFFSPLPPREGLGVSVSIPQKPGFEEKAGILNSRLGI
jgi:hypothetical protein